MSKGLKEGTTPMILGIDIMMNLRLLKRMIIDMRQHKSILNKNLGRKEGKLVYVTPIANLLFRYLREKGTQLFKNMIIQKSLCTNIDQTTNYTEENETNTSQLRREFEKTLYEPKREPESPNKIFTLEYLNSKIVSPGI